MKRGSSETQAEYFVIFALYLSIQKRLRDCILPLMSMRCFVTKIRAQGLAVVTILQALLYFGLNPVGLHHRA